MSQRAGDGVPRYTGDLARPILIDLVRLSPSLSDDTETQSQKVEEIIEQERSRRLMSLFRWHKVPDGDYLGLALALAVSHVPGMQVSFKERRRGRPKVSKKEWDSLQEKNPDSSRLYLLCQLASKDTKGKVGAPQKWPPEVLEFLVLEADRWKEERRKEGVKRPSDRGFIEAVLKVKPAKRRERIAAAQSRSRSAWLSALARGRKMIRNCD